MKVKVSLSKGCLYVNYKLILTKLTIYLEFSMKGIWMMKKSISALLTTVFSTTLLVGCGQSLTANAPQFANQQQFRRASVQRRVKTFRKRSDQGLKVAALRLRELSYAAMDQNKDGVIDVNEFYPGIQHFVKVDINRDGKIDRNEAVNGADFGNAIRSNPSHLRAASKMSWDYINKNKDKYVTKDELLATADPPAPPSEPPTEPPPGRNFTPGYPYSGTDVHQLKVELSKAFNFNDRDYNQKLDFSEFEDMIAFSTVSHNEVPFPVSSTPPSQPTP